MAYGSDYVLKASAEYRGWDVSPYKDIISGMSPSDLGKVAWVRLEDGTYYGPLLVGDSGARHDFYKLVYVNHEIAEIGNRLRELMGFTYSEWGEVVVSLCPPASDSIPVRYQPYLKWDSSGGLDWREWPKQQMPVNCTGWGDGSVYDGAQ